MRAAPCLVWDTRAQTILQKRWPEYVGNLVPMTETFKMDTAVETTTAQVSRAPRPWLNWRTAGIVAALCVFSAFLLEMIASELVSQEVITVIAVAAVFFLLLGFSAARSRALAERPKWFIFAVWGLLLASEEVFSYINDATTPFDPHFPFPPYPHAPLLI